MRQEPYVVYAASVLRAWASGPAPRLSAAQTAQFADIIEAGPDREIDGVVRWRRIDLKRVIAARFGVDYQEHYVGTLLKELGFSHMSACPRHPGWNTETIEAFKNAHLADLPPAAVEIWSRCYEGGQLA